MLGSSLDMVGHVIGRWGRLRAEVTRDAGQVADDAAALWAAAQMRAAQLGLASRSVPRFMRIVRDALAMAAAYRVQFAAAEYLPEAEAAARIERVHAVQAERAYALCVELGGGVLKLGQLVSCRMDVLPAAWAEALGRLQDRVPGEPFDLIRADLEAELGSPLGEAFARFEAEPIAAASLAQVHAAELDDGTRVVVKVLRPGIDEIIAADVAALRFVANVLPGLLNGVDMAPLVERVVASLSDELDLQAEADNAEAFATIFAEHPTVDVPRVYRERSTRRILTLSRVDGRGIARALADAAPATRDEILRTLLDCFCAQVLTYGLVHADPHPGNLLVGDDGRLTLIDFGAVQRYTPAQRRAWGRLAGAVLNRDAERTAALLTELGFRAKSGDTAVLVEYAQLFLEAFSEGIDLESIDPHAQIQRAIELSKTTPVEVPDHFVMLGRVFAALGGLIFAYRPQIDLFQIIAPHLANALTATPSKKS